MTQPPAVLSVDLEYFAHLPAYRGARGTTHRTEVGVEGVHALLDRFDDAGVTGTFFVVSEIADSDPGLLERVAAAGHEVASHTHSHRDFSTLTADERRDELARSKARLESVTGTGIDGFRAPSFHVADDHFRTLGDLGYRYDSSVVPCRSIPGWYGGEFDTTRPGPATTVDPDAPDGLSEVPVAVMPGLGLPLTGSWMRFFGVRYATLGMHALARRGIPPVLYVHPWELVDLPAVDGVPRRVYVRTGEYMRRAVGRILAQPFEFVTTHDLASRGRETGGGDP